jgi:NADPH-dependent curcumin reductase CurA
MENQSMNATSTMNRRILLKQRPLGIAGPEHFTADTIPTRAPEAGEALLETLYVSVDPAMRVWISEQPGYVEPVVPGDVMRAAGIGRVLESGVDDLQPGDLVQGRLGWQSHPTLAGEALVKLDTRLGSALEWIGPLGGTALTAYFGIREVGVMQPSDTVLVSAAAGGVGQLAGQIARLEGCRVVGIAGGAAKCDFITRELGFHAAIDYKHTSDLSASIRRTCPDGVDVYFDNVGGAMLEAALDNLNRRGRVVICGRISQTAAAQRYGVTNLGVLIGKRARIEGFLVSDYAEHFDSARRWLSARLRSGELKQRMHIIEGLDRAPEGLRMLFQGENIGKLVVRVGVETS